MTEGKKDPVRSALLAMEEPVRRATALAEVCTVFALYGEGTDGLTKEECEALLEVCFDLRKAVKMIDKQWRILDSATSPNWVRLPNGQMQKTA
jgi:hypothetical protein